MEGFERNKNLWVGTMIGVAVFFVALMFRGVFVSGDVDGLARQIQRAQNVVRSTAVPPRGATAALREKLGATEDAFASEAAVVAEHRSSHDLAIASIRQVLADIGQADEAAVTPYRDLLTEAPNACFSRLYDEARRHFDRTALDRDVLFSTELGLDGFRFEVDEVDRALHALRVAVRAVNLAMDAGVVEVLDVGVSFQSTAREDESGIEADHVTIRVVGPPSAHASLINRLNDPRRYVALADAEFGGDRRGRQRSRREERNVPLKLTLKTLRVLSRSDDEES